MLYKEDWPEARERWKAFWEGEVVDRVCMTVAAPRDVQVEVPEPPSNMARHTDLDYMIRATNAQFQNTFWGGEAIPAINTRLGYVALGCPNPGFTPTTVWSNPWIPRSSLDHYRFDPNNRWFKLLVEIVEGLVEDSRDKYLVGMPSIDPPTDQLSNLRGMGDLCLDMVDHPEEVQALLQHLTETDQWIKDKFQKMIWWDGGTGGGSVRWHPGRSISLQCDFSIALGPEMFRKFVLPELEFLGAWAGIATYHLDGRGALHHLPTILDLEEIKWVNLTPAGGTEGPEGEPLDWVDAVKAIRATGRGVHFRVSYDRVEEAIRRIGPKGLCLCVIAPTEEAARKLLKDAERWSCQHPWDIQ